ncbi:MAG: hypothetical protein PWP23_1449 [Candidatus Sumerlaeota bacterium]|nr:hypothetical protein [Candidatus Sumerlaeota bacterium]
MEQREKILQAHAALEAALHASEIRPVAFVGLDGFVDEIARVVDQRQDFEHYTPIRTISDYAARLAGAAGKSTNVELVIQEIKMGGNGPLMADALGRLSVRVNSAGALGHPVLHPVFHPLEEYGRVVSLADPAVTLAAEFDDGKIMHGKLDTLNEITPENLVRAAGGEKALSELMEETDLIALVNWTMIPHLTECYRSILEYLEKVGPNSAPSIVFFDLCDPQKRSRADLRAAIAVMAEFASVGSRPVLGLNEKESSEVCEALGIEAGESNPDALADRARRISTASGIPEVVIHPRTYAVVVSPESEGHIDGPVCANPRLTTGAGDHFNGGYCFGRLMGLAPADAIVIGKAVSGYYVRAGHGPSENGVLEFLTRWVDGQVDPW